MPSILAERKQRAFVLLIVISMMAVLSILATSFAMMSRIERNVSANNVDTVRARMLAQAGIEQAITSLRIGSGAKGWEALSEPWACGDPPSTPITALTLPSYRLPAAAYGRRISGRVSATYEPDGDTYVLRVVDGASRIFVNGKQPGMAQMLDNLGSAIAMEGLGANPCPPGTGARIVAARNGMPGGVFASKEEIEPIVGVVPWRLLRSFLTDKAWEDPGVITPKPQSVIGGFTSGPIAENLTYQTAVQATGAGRAPVNVNTASVPVLMACITGLQGIWLECQNARFRRTQCAAIAMGQAQTIARRIAQDRLVTPFRDMQQFLGYIDQILPPVGIGNPNLPGELIKAMANPNTLLNKFNPNRVVTNWVGKEELTYYTTEFCFASMGYYEIESLGRVTGTGGVEAATRRIRTFVKLYDVLRHSTQADFQAAYSAGSSGGIVRTFPENLYDFNRPSALDGQVCIKERDPNGGGQVPFRAVYDDTLLGTDGFMRYNFFGIDDCQENRSVFAASNQAASDLFPDGNYMSEFRSKLTHYSSYYNVEPRDGTIEFWMKPDRLTYSGALQGVALVLVPHEPQKGYAWIIGNQPGFGFIINGGHYRDLFGPGAGDYPGTRFRNDLPWAGNDYFMLGSANPGNRLLWGDWHHVAISWDNYVNIRVYFDGVKVIDYAGYYVALPNYVGLNGATATDEMQIGTFAYPSWWQGAWGAGNAPFWNDYTEATMDNIETRLRSAYNQGSFNAPDRYTRSNGGTSYVGDFTIPPAPPGAPATVRVGTISMTSYKPTTDNLGNPIAPANRPNVKLQWMDPGSGNWSSLLNDEGGPVGLYVNRGGTFRYRVRWYDEGLSPNDCPAYLDDVTIFYTGKLEYLSYADDPS